MLSAHVRFGKPFCFTLLDGFARSAIRLRLQPLVFCDAVDRNERKQDRGLLYICLIFGDGAIDLVLTELKSASTAEHHIYDACITDGRDEPLPPRAACPETY